MDLQIDDHESYQVKVVIREKMVLSSTKVKNGFWDGSWVLAWDGKFFTRQYRADYVTTCLYGAARIRHMCDRMFHE